MSNCAKFSKGEVCFDDGTTLQTLFAHTEYGINIDGDSIVVATRYTDAADVPVDTSGGVVTVGACLVAATFAPDVETKVLCDVQTDGTSIEFCRTTVTTFDEGGAVDTRIVSDFELDGSTTYTVAGDVGVCSEGCEPSIAEGVLTTW